MSKTRILVIDNEEDFVRMIKLNLEKRGNYEVMTLTQPIRALAAVKKFRPDLILLDVVMPDVDGGAVAAQLESDENCKDIPIVFLTVIMSEEESYSIKGMAGTHPCLSKSVAMGELVECIENNLRNRRQK